MRLSRLAVLGCLAAAAAAPAFANDTDVDPSFAPTANLDGWTRQYFGTTDEKTVGLARATTATDAGFILATSVSGGSNGARVGLFKLDRNGTRVADFGVAGRIVTDTGFTTVDAMTVDGSGRIVVVGSRPGFGGVGDFAIARFQPNGSLDPAFGTSGVTSYTFEQSSTAFAEASRSVLTDTDGKIVVAGNVGIPSASSNRFGLFRLNVDGTLDTTFGNLVNGSGFRGVVERFSGTRDAYAAKVLKVGGNHYVVVGTSVYSSTDTDFAARLILPDGGIWANDTGTISLPIDEPGNGGSLYDTAISAATTGPTTVVVAGTASGHAAARRFKLGGLSGGLYTTLTNDTDFVGSAIAGRPNRFVSIYADTYPNALAVRGNGDILMVGRIPDGVTAGRQLGLLTRLRANGSPDPDFSFSDGASVLYAPVSGNAGTSWYTELTAVVLDGARPVIAGSAVDSTAAVNDFDAVVARLSSDMIFADGFQ
ncbi:MAG: delta-60 repeat domain-containing protein [Xanthomonadales bacterium]|nr:delta-60 repeat domain-containing protein [Xanthomonadales bacterium]